MAVQSNYVKDGANDVKDGANSVIDGEMAWFGQVLLEGREVTLLQWNRILTADVGVIAFTGNDATLTHA